MNIKDNIISIIGNILKNPIRKLHAISTYGLSVVAHMIDNNASIMADPVIISLERNRILTRISITMAIPIPIVPALLAIETYSVYVASAPVKSVRTLVYTPEIVIMGNMKKIISSSIKGLGTQLANGPLLYIIY